MLNYKIIPPDPWYVFTIKSQIRAEKLAAFTAEKSALKSA